MQALHAATLLLCVSPALLAQSLPEVEATGTSGANDAPAAAELAIANLQMFGEIGLAADVDCWQFTLAAPADVRAMTGPGFSGQAGDTILTLYAYVSGVLSAPIATNDDGANRGYYSEVTAGGLVPLAAGDYYVLEVKHYSNLAVGSYVLDLLEAPVGDLVPVFPPLLPGIAAVEIDDPRVALGAANATLCDTTNSGNLAVGGAGTAYGSGTADYDFFSFVVGTAPMRVRLATGPGAATTATDTVVHLADGLFAQLAFDDDGGPGLYSLLEFTVTTPGLYHAVVAGWGAATGVGNYTLDIQCAPTPPEGSATWTNQGGGCPGSLGTPLLDTRLVSTFHAIHVERPFLGTEFSVDLTSVPTSAPYFRLIGFGTLGTPIDLFSLGIGWPGCLVTVNPLVTGLSFTNAAGYDFWNLPLPYDLNYLGLTLELQVAVLDGALWTVSNRGTAVLGNVY